ALVAAVSARTPIEHPIAWLRTVALRRIQDHFRAAARVQHLLEQAQCAEVCEDHQDPAKQHDRKLKRQAVRSAMDGLPESYRLALEWKYVERLSVRVIAQRLSVTEKSVESVLFRARRALRNLLRGDNSEPPQRNVATEKSVGGLPAKSDKPSGSAEQPGNESDDSSPQRRPSLFLKWGLAPES
ncbi:MAG: sigma-70 family RNA polymerase sigma factor, partial [Pirellulales bacterium]|nr:sigma-70 family RNA polymerase sigma factor [Pirellulales bacterium]